MDVLSPYMSYIPYLAAGLLALIGLVLGLSWWQLARVRCQYFQSAFMDQDDISVELASVFDEAREVVLGLGFAYSHTMLEESFHANQDARPCQVYVHAKTKTVAHVRPASLPESSQLFDLFFITRFTDGGRIETIDCMLHRELPAPPSCDIYDHYCGHPEQQWEHHQATLQAAAGRRPVLGSAEQLLEAHNRHSQSFVTHGVETGWLKPAAEADRWQLRPLTALKYACRIQL